MSERPLLWKNFLMVGKRWNVGGCCEPVHYGWKTVVVTMGSIPTDEPDAIRRRRNSNRDTPHRDIAPEVRASPHYGWQDVVIGRFHGNRRLTPSPAAMKNYDNSSVNAIGTAAHLGFLTGGPLDSLLEQLAGTRVLPSPVTAPLPVIAADCDASASDGPALSGDPFLAVQKRPHSNLPFAQKGLGM